MKFWLYIGLTVGLFVSTTSTMAVEAQAIKAEKVVAQAEAKTAAEPVAMKCPKCQGDMEPGYLLEIEGQATNDKGPTQWVQGPVQGSFWTGVVLRGRGRLNVAAYRCTSCGFLELYAK